VTQQPTRLKALLRVAAISIRCPRCKTVEVGRATETEFPTVDGAVLQCWKCKAIVEVSTATLDRVFDKSFRESRR